MEDVTGSEKQINRHLKINRYIWTFPVSQGSTSLTESVLPYNGQRDKLVHLHTLDDELPLV